MNEGDREFFQEMRELTTRIVHTEVGSSERKRLFRLFDERLARFGGVLPRGYQKLYYRFKKNYGE